MDAPLGTKTCARPSCGATFPVPTDADEVVCPHCGLRQPGPAPVVRHGDVTDVLAEVRRQGRSQASGGPEPSVVVDLRDGTRRDRSIDPA